MLIFYSSVRRMTCRIVPAVKPVTSLSTSALLACHGVAPRQKGHPIIYLASWCSLLSTVSLLTKRWSCCRAECNLPPAEICSPTRYNMNRLTPILWSGQLESLALTAWRSLYITDQCTDHNPSLRITMAGAVTSSAWDKTVGANTSGLTMAV